MSGLVFLKPMLHEKLWSGRRLARGYAFGPRDVINTCECCRVARLACGHD